MEIIVRLP